MLTNLNKILSDARKGGYAIAQFNFSDLEVAQGIAEGASEMGSSVIFGASEKAIEYAGIENLVDIVKNLSEQFSQIPMALHLDHGKTFEICQKAIEAGFTSVMVDGSKHPFEENIKLTRKVVEFAKGKDISVEGELGMVADLKKLEIDKDAIVFPTGEQAREFIEKTGVDALAVGLGTAHGLPLPDERIHFAVLKEVADAVSAPLVLHGGSNLPTLDVKKAVKMGVCKVNVDTELRQAFTGAIRKDLKDKATLDPREYLGDAREAIKQAVIRKIKEINGEH
ncbi:tagatose-bisphosphate aldolase [Candidatus Berkelbacteria bacterium CG03_land_8_20_14_0_80_40_36]|uniref:Tagatose-bisphosphate aldolase n=3 Tax=Bacteria candidate phyla TaxID=1783234 RepID=A0A2M7CHU8_9BACT|nr:MAG: tagatose-bisphosphate aldolase [Candidatus Berkelbacteria bacterium CG03_land_8_20_14_0_80_40_36]PIX30701.1 MAG: tagatose-bisphosphate aldolase [Candidatus Berkelbacteria bacterium CG_4_8_14_3_um_filter_39_27]